MADRIVVMNAGRIEQVGSPLELYDRPVNRFVAGFLGSPSMSFIPGDARARRRRAAAARRGRRRCCPRRRSSARSGQRVEIGVRPEHYRLAADGAGFPFRVEVVEPTGSETHVFGTIAGTPVRCVFRERVAAKPGDRLRLDVDPDRVHVFDADAASPALNCDDRAAASETELAVYRHAGDALRPDRPRQGRGESRARAGLRRRASTEAASAYQDPQARPVRQAAGRARRGRDHLPEARRGGGDGGRWPRRYLSSL